MRILASSIVLICTITSGAQRTTSPEIDLLVRQALEDRLAANNLPDGNLLGNSKRIAIRQEMPAAKLKMGRSALPQREGHEFYFISEAAAQSEADFTKQPVHFITVDGPSIAGDTALISLGVDVIFPRTPKVGKLCCCTGRGQFRRAEGRWTFVKWVDMVCS
jgi:hypothetical protein